MTEILPVVLSGIQADLARAERAAMNLANSQTPGYKRTVAVPFASRIEGAGSQAGMDLRAGTLKNTGRPLDLAIVGEGWFEVATPDGPAFTRQGEFRLDASGRLVTQHGHLVMGTAGAIQLMHGTPRIDAAGRVFDPQGTSAPAASPVAQIKVVRFEGTEPPQRLGNGLVTHGGTALVAPDGGFELQQGVLENSNVSPMHEMVELMQSVRHLESMQKVAIAFDEMLATSIRKLGEG